MRQMNNATDETYATSTLCREIFNTSRRKSWKYLHHIRQIEESESLQLDQTRRILVHESEKKIILAADFLYDL